MKTPRLTRFLPALVSCLIPTMPLHAAEPNESNLTLLDTESPAIRDLAKFAGDESTYIGMKDRNKIGVFFSERFLGADRLNMELLKPWEGKGSWSINDFLHQSTGPMFFMSDGRYQALPIYEIPTWSRPHTESLLWYSRSDSLAEQFKARLNAPTEKVVSYKRFEFPANLNYTPQGSGVFGGVHDFDTNRATVDANARKLVIVIHGWSREPKTDPYKDGEWKALMENLHEEIQSKVPYAPDWDLYAYRWGRDSYTGNLFGNSGVTSAAYPESWYMHGAGQVGLGVENGTQAAEIGYQHGLVLGKLLAERDVPLEKVHFIAHSAGTWVARSASMYLHAHYGSSLKQQISLVDPYNPKVGRAEYVDKNPDATIDDSILGSNQIESGWRGVVEPLRAENIYSVDEEVVGTNNEYDSFINLEVGTSRFGATWNLRSAWNGHGGPINYYAYTVDPSNKSTSTIFDRNERSDFAGDAGWEHSLLMQEYKQWHTDHPIPGFDFNSVMNTGFAVSTAPVISPQNVDDGPVFAPSSIPEWSQVLVDVDDSGWVRAMLVPTSGGAAVLAGPARLAAEGTFAITLDDGLVLSGSFDTSTTPPVLTLALDGNPLGQPKSAAQGSTAQRGFDVTVNDSGNLVISAILADGTTGMSVSRDTDSIGWEGSGVGTLDENGNIVVTGVDGLRVTGNVREDGGLDAQVAPPQVPKIHLLGTAGTGLATGAASTDCGRVAVGRTSPSFHFTIQSTGTVDLADLGVSVDGPHGGDFAVSSPDVTSLAPDASATVTVAFSPGAVGRRSATLRISSNDANKSPFEIALTGEGFEAAPVEMAGTTAGTVAAGEGAHFRVTVTEPGVLIAWTEGGTDTHGMILATDGRPLGEDADSGLQANFRTSVDVVPGDFFIQVAGGDAAASGPYALRTRFIPATEPMQVSHFEKDGPDVMLGFTNTKGALHILEYSTDMRNWLPLLNLVGEGAEMLMPLPGLGYGTTGFFRVGLVAGGYDPDVAEGIDQPGEAITPEGDAAWFTQTSVSYDGTDASRSGLIYENQSSGFSMQVTGPINIDFWWKVSSASGDELCFLIDGELQAGAISGETGWLQQCHTFGSGTHTLTWSYAKNGNGDSAGQDCGWVDEVVFSYPADIAVELPPGSEVVNGATFDFGAVPENSEHQRTFTIRNKGGMDLTGMAISAIGDFSWEFQHTQPTATTLAPGESTTFTVTFGPWSIEPGNATLRIASNDPDENPFELLLTGSGVEMGDYDYQIADGEIAINRYSGPGGEVLLPAEIMGFPVTSITGVGGFDDFGSGDPVTSITIPSGIEIIERHVFDWADALTTITVDSASPAFTSLDGILYDKSLTTLIRCPEAKTGEVTVPASVTTIERGAFTRCSIITGISIPSSVQTIGDDAFRYCDGLTAINVNPSNLIYRSVDGILYDKNVTTLIRCPGGMVGSVSIPAGVTTIADSAFEACGAVTDVTMPETLESIGNDAFSFCWSLTGVTIPDGVGSIGTRAFEYCQALTGVSIPGSVISIAGYTFHGCSSLDGIIIPASVTSIGEGAFYDCGALTSVTFSTGLTSIGSYAFGACTSLTSLTVPASVSSIGDGPFAGCLSLPEISVAPANATYFSQDGVLFNQAVTHLIQCPAGKTGRYTVPDGVTSIGRNAFGWCESLTSVIIPVSVTSIGDNAFLKCDNLANAVFLGNAPSTEWGIFEQAPPGFRVFYAPESTGFTTPTWMGYPAEPLAPMQAVVVIGPAGSLADGSGSVSFGNIYPGSQRQRTITILNAGMADLSGLAITKDGTNPEDFIVGSLGPTTLATGESTTFTVTFAPTVIGARSCNLQIASNDPDKNPFDIHLAGTGLDPALDVTAAIEVSPRPVTHGGAADWLWQADVSHDGIDAAQSGDIPDSQKSSFSITAMGPGTVSFQWKVSSEGGYDFLRFRINGVEQGEGISGEVDWQQVNFPLGEGDHTLEWSYEKDESYSGGTDCGWVDEVSLPPVSDMEALLLASFGTTSNTGDAADDADVDRDGTEGGHTLEESDEKNESHSEGTERGWVNNVSLPPMNALELWRLTNFGTTANTCDAADCADLDQDGIPNLMEFAFGLDPFQPSAHLMPAWKRDGNVLVCTFPQQPGISEITYGAEWSPSMEPGSWQSVNDEGDVSGHTFRVPIDDRSQKFMRIKVSRVPDFLLIPPVYLAPVRNCVPHLDR